ncbi:virB8 family protein [Luteimonas soli]|uniref:VirB8 family protein n=1 Tax=Luteimonas soli TaxID=1648966 RepID=A0ABV7XGA4_9GAMM
MNPKKMKPETNLKHYQEAAAGWESAEIAAVKRSEKRAWRVAISAAVLAGLAVLAVVLLTPLKTVEPFVVQVDKIGAANTVTLLDTRSITANEALDKYWLGQYVNYREEYLNQTSYGNYRATRLLSSQAVGSAYFQQANPENPRSPSAVYGTKGTVEISVTSITFISKNQAQVRFVRREKRNSDQQPVETRWIATIAYQYLNPPLKEAERLINPVGFQVTDYRLDPETVTVGGGN